MARILFFAIMAMCLFCMLQAKPAEPQNTTPDPLQQIGVAVQEGLRTAQQGVQDFVNDPSVKKFMDDGAKLFSDGAEAVRKHIEKAFEIKPETN